MSSKFAVFCERVMEAGQLITELNSYSGLFKAHDPQQVQEMMQH